MLNYQRVINWKYSSSLAPIAPKNVSDDFEYKKNQHHQSSQITNHDESSITIAINHHKLSTVNHHQSSSSKS